MKRREFMLDCGRLAVGVAASVGGLAVLVPRLRPAPPAGSPALEVGVLRPPGAIAEADFLTACVRCRRCADACPLGAIRLAGEGDGVAEGTPYVVPLAQPCDLCLDCTTVCPTGALLPVARQEDVRMGTARIDKETCVSHNRTGVCGACHTVCPLHNRAITQGLYNAPEVHDDACVGCGLCENACIVKGTPAIRVFSTRRPA